MRKSKEKGMSQSATSPFPLNLKSSRKRSPSILNFKLQNCLEERIVIPRDKKKKQDNQHDHLLSTCKPIIQSMRVSRHLIEQEDHKNAIIQFSKKNKSHLRHVRTQSNQVAHEDDHLSNFSNSLENISQEIIEIPCAKRKIIPKNKENAVINRNSRGLEFRRKNSSTQSKKVSEIKNGSLDLNFRNSKRSTLRESLLSFNKRDPNRQILNLIPKPKKNSSNNFIFKIAITDFSLKAMKITNNGSIMYLALHKATGSVYTIKSIRKAAIKGRINQILLEIKLGLLFGHPNYTKVYGFFSDNENFYIIKQYLEEGCITEYRSQLNDHLISQSLNQVLFAVSCLSDFLDMRKWSIDITKIAKSNGIAKLTSINFNEQNIDFNSEETKQTIEWFFQVDDRRSTLEGTTVTNYSNLSKCNFSGTSKQTTSFVETLSTLFMVNPNSILNLLEHPFLRQTRFKATMQQ